jgi:penicillin-binding protein 1A
MGMSSPLEGPRLPVQIANPADGGFFYWLFKLYLFGVLSIFAFALASLPVIYIVVAGAVETPPDLDSYLEHTELESQIFSSDGQVLTTLVDKRRYLARYEEIPPLLIKAFLAAEDRSFFTHGGVDFRGIIRATVANFRAGGVRQGGSTITQQVAKSFLSSERTIQRKLKEIVLARRIETLYSKREILTLYLNQIFLGANAYGVKAAARVYFDKNLSELSVGEMALIAGLVRAPSRYSPKVAPTEAKLRRNRVLASMQESGAISKEQLDRALSEGIRLAPVEVDPLPLIAPHFAEHARRQLVDRYGREAVYGAGWRVETTVDLPLQQLAQTRTSDAVHALDRRQGYRGPFFRTRSDRDRRALLERARALYKTDALEVDRPYPMLVEKVTSGRAEGRIGDRKVVLPSTLLEWAAPYTRTNAENDRTIASAKDALEPGDVAWVISPPHWLRHRTWGQPGDREPQVALHQVPRIEGALYSYDHQTGYVLAMVGGLDFDRSSFNRTTQACRQPGSTYKPIYYSLALDSDDYSMATVLQDKPYQPEEGEEWNPQNIHGTLDGRVTMHRALTLSLNLPSIQLLNKVGAKETEAWARRLGFTTPIHADKALALGASCVRTDELTRTFATFARGGTQMDPVYIRRIVDRNGTTLEDHTTPEDPLLPEGDRFDRAWARSTYRPKQVIDPRTAFLITKLLRDSVLLGIAARCQIVAAPTAGKGGTSSDTMDVWFIGFTSQWVTTAWIGDDTYQRPLGEKEASYTSAIPMWANYMRDAIGKRPHTDLPIKRPAGLKTAVVDLITGGAPKPDSKSVVIYFRPGSYSPPKEDGS